MAADGQNEVDREILEATLQTAIEAGVRVQMSGGYTSRVYDTMEAIAKGLGAEQVEGSVSSVVVGLTVHRAGWSRTAFRRTPRIGINFSELSALSQLTKQAPHLAPDEIRQRLTAIESLERRYPLALILPMLGASTASFAALFGADAVGIVLAGLGGLAGAWLRHELAGRHYKPFIFCLAAAFLSTGIVLLGSGWTETSSDAVAACVLYLVPGVPLLNGTADLLSGHYLNGVVRLVMGLVIVLGSAVGVGLALGLAGWLA